MTTFNLHLKAEMNRQLSEIEARNSKMQSETDRLRAMNEELSSRLAASQALYDRSVSFNCQQSF